MNNYCVYEHIFPNGKRYVGLSNNCNKRWKNGEGYISNKEMYKAICKYGWNNIEHKIIADNLSRQEAQQLEKEMIANRNSTVNGFNKSKGGESGKTFYSSHVMYILNRAKHYNLFKEWCDMYLGYADNEDTCSLINYFDLIIKKDKRVSECVNDEYMQFAYYLCMMRDAIIGIDISDPNYRLGAFIR